MIANYHTHTPRCHHAQGSEEDFAQAAIAGGLQILGFSDHTPYFFPGDYYSNFRMRPEELEDYANAVRAAAEKYRGQLEIHLGVEAEFYPDYFPRLLEHLRSHGVEYMILAMHFVNHEQGELYSGRPSPSVERLERYVDQSIEAFSTGLYTYMAHPDMINFQGDEALFDRHMRRLAQAAREYDIPLEINLLGAGEGRNYPNDRFWRIAGEEGCKAIIGCDAHNPGMIPNAAAEVKALEIVRKYDLQLLHTVDLRPIG